MVRSAILVILVLLSFSSQAQFPSSRFFDSQVTYYGINYSMVKMVGSYTFTNPERIVNHFFMTWNELIFDEPAKYDLKKCLQIDSFHIDLSFVKEINLAVNANLLVHDAPHELTKQMISAELLKYSFKQDDGIGIMFFAENYDFEKKDGTHILAVIDLADKSVLFARRYHGTPGGVSFRNYWSRPYWRILSATLREDMKEWKKE